MGVQGNIDLHFWITRGMARRLGVNLSEAMHDGDLSQAEFACMVERCRGCSGAKGCLAYLADPSAQDLSTPDWCKNVPALRALSKLT